MHGVSSLAKFTAIETDESPPVPSLSGLVRGA